MEDLIMPDAYNAYQTTRNDAYAELEKKLAPIWVAYGNMRAGVCKEVSAKEWAAYMIVYNVANKEFKSIIKDALSKFELQKNLNKC